MEFCRPLCLVILMSWIATFSPGFCADDGSMHMGGHMDVTTASMHMDGAHNGMTMNNAGGHGGDHHMGMDHTTAADHNTDHSGHGGHGGGVDNGGSQHNSHVGHPSFFHTGLENTILFFQWATTSWQTLLGSCIAICVLAALYEGFKVLREDLFSKQMITRKHKNGTNCCKAMCSGPHILQSLLHILQVFVSYVLMLVFMTFNVYLCVAVLLGAGIGYFLFGWRRTLVRDVNEHCV